jgi:hypothetical protein
MSFNRHPVANGLARHILACLPYLFSPDTGDSYSHSDTTGTMTAMARQASLYSENERDFEGSSVGFLVDSGCIALSGLCFGCSPCTPFVGKS